MRRLTTCGRPGGAGGFTLLEVMVAMAIMALVVAGVMHIFSSSLAGIGKSELYTEGLLVARNVMEVYLLNPTLEEGSLTGVEGETFHWELVSTGRDLAFDPEMGAPGSSGENRGSIDWVQEKSPLRLYEITVRVTWPDAAFPGHIKLSTLSLRIDPEEEEIPDE